MTKPVAIPAKIGDPSLIKHVFLIIRENRTYDQILGDVAAGNGDPSLAVFGGKDTPNAHKLVKRFPLFDNFYDPSRQSADGHQWITEGMAPYADDIQSPDWVRSYPGGNAGDALAYQNKGFLFSEAAAAGLPVKIYGEYVENDTFLQPNGSTSEPSWSRLLQRRAEVRGWAGDDAVLSEHGPGSSPLSRPCTNHLIKNFPQFDLGIPDQFRVDLWVQDFKKDVAAGTVPALSILWIMDDHTGGPPTPDAEQADNDLAVGRIIDYISHSNVWSIVGDLHRGRRRAERRRPRRRSSQPRLYRQPIRRAERTHRPHLLHAGQHDSDDRANPRSAAHEPVRPRGVADEDGFRQGHAARGQLPAVDARAEPGPAGRGRYSERSQPNGRRQDQGPEGGLAPEEGGDLRRQTDQARLRRPGHRQPSELVHVHRVYAALSRREARFAPRATSTTRHPPATTRTTKTRSDCNGPLPGHRGEAFFSSYNALRLLVGDCLRRIWRADSGLWRRDLRY